jgi:tRNA (guanine37-N1)-methyltransferase
MFASLTCSKIVTRALEKNVFQLNLHDLRSFTEDKHRTLDDVPYGGVHDVDRL